MRRLKSNSIPPIAFLCIAFAGGCGSKYPETAPVEGKITAGGAPVTTGRISFYPTSGARLSSGEIQPDGSYSLTTFKPNDGALLGSHRVTITSTKVVGPQTAKSIQDESQTPVSSLGHLVWLVDEKYSEQSTTVLQTEVKSGSNTIDFNLPGSAAKPSS
jgi:hypothetical protein